MAEVSPRTADIVAHLPGVIRSVRGEAEEIGARAGAQLSQHRATGNAEIEVSSGRVDSFVSLVDPAALSIEFGAFNERAERYVPGLYIVTRAAGL
ncbi:DUF5403 family protein [Actinomycetospora sp. CA-053990]|uniref:DUF5403 family protein n=1 Tax=Actinomycetospora sp. CA-053990 TaxID=3239891 RepID=UPI003D8C4CC3